MRAQRSAERLISLDPLGPLWVSEEPNWTQLKWPSVEDYEYHERLEWGLDAPEHLPRVAPLHAPSSNLPHDWAEVLHDREVTLRYSATRDMKCSESEHGRHSIAKSWPRKHRISHVLVARHLFRRPAPTRTFEEFIGSIGAARSLDSLKSLFAVHDGALLFHPDGVPAAHAHADLLGLRDQRPAMRALVYDIQSVSRQGTERVTTFFEDLHCDSDSCLILCAAGVSMFVVPLLGMNQGRVFRIVPRASLVKPWADDPVEGVRRVCQSLPRLCARAPLPINVDESTPNIFAEMRLKRIVDPWE
ncbi:MAG: hypothetical protein KF768_13255 [Phycisphaeraceae bacterium]|nr:hypothetical protein [Phycisphaeraceae bacterium]